MLKFILKLRLTDLEGKCGSDEDMHDSSAGILASSWPHKLGSCVTQGKLLNLSESQLRTLLDADDYLPLPNRTVAEIRQELA